jgi:hypothetical protein
MIFTLFKIYFKKSKLPVPMNVTEPKDYIERFYCYLEVLNMRIVAFLAYVKMIISSYRKTPLLYSQHV